MSFLWKLFERQSGITQMKKGYSDPSTEMVQAALKGDTDELLAIMFCPMEDDSQENQ
jgi:hypothetical protein